MSQFQIPLAVISVTVQLWTQMFLVVSAYFNIRNTLPKSATFLLGHPVSYDLVYKSRDLWLWGPVALTMQHPNTCIGWH
jgi:hypothetical protein